jgi:hypothetical protein
MVRAPSRDSEPPPQADSTGTRRIELVTNIENSGNPVLGIAVY